MRLVVSGSQPRAKTVIGEARTKPIKAIEAKQGGLGSCEDFS